MASTPILPLALWLPGTNQNSIPANDNALRIEALNREIISQAVTAQPASPVDGDTYIIAATHTGAQWATFTPNDLAIFKSGTWYAWAPTEGLIVNVAGSEYAFDGVAWVSAGGGGMTNPMTSTGDIIYSSSGSTPARLAAGTNGYVLTLAAGVPTWAAATGGFSNPMTTVGDLIVGGVAGAAGSLAAGTATYVLTSNGPGVAPTWQAAGGGGGVTGFTTSLNTTSPNNTVNASVLAASGGSTIQDAVITPKSTGSFILGPAPDGTAAGGNKRGIGSVDLQLFRSNATYVVTGTNALAAGTNNTVTGNAAIALGNVLVSSGAASFATGTSGTASGTNSAVFGDSSQATATTAMAIGANTRATAVSAFSAGSSSRADGVNSVTIGRFGTSRTTANSLTLGATAGGNIGNQQSRFIPLVGTSTSATSVELTSDGAAGGTANRIVLPFRSAFSMEIDVCAFSDPATAQSWKITAFVRQGGSSPAVFVGAGPTSTIVFGDAAASAWTAVLSISGSSVILTATGASGTTIRWSALARVVEAGTI